MESSPQQPEPSSSPHPYLILPTWKQLWPFLAKICVRFEEIWGKIVIQMEAEKARAQKSWGVVLEEDLGSVDSVKGNLVDTSPSLSPHNQLNMTQNNHVPNLTPQQASFW